MLTIGPAPAQTAADPVLTREQVAHLFRVSPRTVQRWGKTGKLPSLRASDVANLLNPASDEPPRAPAPGNPQSQ